MCSQTSLEKAKNGQALIVSKLSLALALIIVLAGYVSAYAVLKYQVNNHEVRICTVEMSQEELSVDILQRLSRIEGMLEQKYNAKNAVQE